MDHIVPISIVFAAAASPQIIEMSEAPIVQALDVVALGGCKVPELPIETMVQLLTAIMDPIDKRRVEAGYALTYPSSGGQHLMALHADVILIANFDSKNAFVDLEVGYKLLEQTYQVIENLYNMVNDQMQLIDAVSNPLSPLLALMESNQRALMKAKEQQEAMVSEVKKTLRKQFQVYPIPQVD